VRPSPAPTAEGPLAERPLLAPWLRRADVDGRIVLEYGDEIVILGGVRARAVLDGLLSLLDGSRSAADIARELRTPLAAVEGALADLRAHGLVVPGPPAGGAATLCAALAPGTSPAEAEERLSEAAVAVVGGSHCADELVRLLRPVVGRAGRIAWDDLEDADVATAAPSPAELPLLERWNTRMLEHGTPWLQVLPFNGRLAALGPLFIPGETCCHACFRHRRGASLGEPELAAALDAVPAPYPQPALLSTALAGLAAALLVQWLATRHPALPGTLFALELEPGIRVDAHRVLRVPRCPACCQAHGLAAPLPWAVA
jgi:bacteriocin biosynthesis cyclodehydratase domain-containing protein